MNHDDREPEDHAFAGHREIDALLDGEPVNKDALRAALADADTRDYLLDALALREMTREMGPVSFVAPVATSSAASRARMRMTRWVAAAVVVAAIATGVYLYVQLSMKWRDRGAQFMTAADVPEVIEMERVYSYAPLLQEPTTVIRLEPGVNWTEPKWSR